MMAEFQISLKPAPRPIYYKGKKALFHLWSTYSYVIAPSPMIGGHNGGVISGTVAIIETADGKICEVYPNEIQFADPEFPSKIWNAQRIRPQINEGVESKESS